MLNGECETLQEGKNNIFLREPETFLLFQLEDSLKMRASDVQVKSFQCHLKINKSLLHDFLALINVKTAKRT